VAILLFGYGAATPDQAGLMGLIVSVFMLGLLPFTLFYVLLRGYYALEDTRTPFWVTVAFSVILLVTVYPLFNFVPVGGSQVAAIALAYSIAYWLAFAITWWILARRLGAMESGRTAWVLGRLVIAGAVSVGVMLACLTLLVHVETGGIASDLDRLTLLMNVALTSILGVGFFLGAAWVLRIHEVSDVLSLAGRVVRRRGHR
jgi:putative peptidoglycan lipid II flippase